MGQLWVRNKTSLCPKSKLKMTFKEKNIPPHFGPLEQGMPEEGATMIVFSFNVHGVGGAPKILSLK
jgi:hypothetical protein